MIKPYDGSLYRGLTEAPETRTDGDGASSSYLTGHFAVFDVWTEIHSYYEGDFVERLAAGSFKKTIKDARAQEKTTGRFPIVCQFDHGYDMHVGDMPLGPFDDLGEDDEGVRYGVPLLDTDYNRDRLLPLLAGRTMDGAEHGSLLGASFRFRVVRDDWVREPKASEHNPDALPERTIREVRLFEGGPVVFPAYEEASAGVRSLCLTDRYEDRAREARSSRTPPAAPRTGDDPTTAPPSGHPEDTRGGLLLAAANTRLRRKKHP